MKIFQLHIVVFTAVFLIKCTPHSQSARPTPISVLQRPAGAASAAGNDVTPLQSLVAGSLEQPSYTLTYDPSYEKLDYPMGDVPLERGVCADVVVRAFRKAAIDLQKEVHEDMKQSFGAYPNKWGAKGPDRNIDHRRVANLMTYFERKGKTVAVSAEAKTYLPGDVVAWELDDGRLHIGMVTDEKSKATSNYLMVHNIGAGAQLEDVIFAWKVIGHYRYFPDVAVRPTKD